MERKRVDGTTVAGRIAGGGVRDLRMEKGEGKKQVHGEEEGKIGSSPEREQLRKTGGKAWTGNRGGEEEVWDIGATGRMRGGGGAGGGAGEWPEMEVEMMAARRWRRRLEDGGVAMIAEKNRGSGKEWRRSSRRRQHGGVRRLDPFPDLP